MDTTARPMYHNPDSPGLVSSLFVPEYPARPDAACRMRHAGCGGARGRILTRGE